MRKQNTQSFLESLTWKFKLMFPEIKARFVEKKSKHTESHLI